ncbi:MAG: class I SAM-dependent methyltransferase [Candidatus Methanofastidiosa archaeon]|nr:class I SAM-dependent methyltransferase [Candidatus Methanofastidiosa archaeon]
MDKGGSIDRAPFMHGIERAFVNSRWKRLFQRWEVWTYRSLLSKEAIALPRTAILDAGCGAGYGLSAIARTWHPERLCGIDIDPDEVRRARIHAPYAEVSEGSLLSLPYADATFDTVFVFGVLHHIASWEQALYELSRVQRQGGILCLNEHDRRSVSLLQHLGIEQQEGGLFSWKELEGGLVRAGYEALSSRRYGGFGFFVCRKD